MTRLYVWLLTKTETLRNRLRDDRGASITEYLMVVGVSIAIGGVLYSVFKPVISNWINAISNKFNNILNGF